MLLKRIAVLVGSILGMSASSQAAQLDDGTHMLTTEDAVLGPEARVKAFITDYHRSHSILRAKKGDDEFERWEQLVQTLDQTHFIDHAGRELGDEIHGKSPHTLAGESIVGVKRAGERVLVETRIEAASRPKFYEYELCEVAAGNWKIMRLREFLDPADAPFLSERERPRFAHPRLHPLQRLSAAEARFDGNKIFARGKSVELDGKSSSIEVRELGLLNITTGILVWATWATIPACFRP